MDAGLERLYAARWGAFAFRKDQDDFAELQLVDDGFEEKEQLMKRRKQERGLV